MPETVTYKVTAFKEREDAVRDVFEEFSDSLGTEVVDETTTEHGDFVFEVEVTGSDTKISDFESTLGGIGKVGVSIR